MWLPVASIRTLTILRAKIDGEVLVPRAERSALRRRGWSFEGGATAASNAVLRKSTCAEVFIVGRQESGQPGSNLLLEY